jgi:hypothetical protein
LFRRPKLTPSCRAEKKKKKKKKKEKEKKKKRKEESGRCVKLSAHFCLMPRSRMVELYFHSPIRSQSILLN